MPMRPVLSSIGTISYQCARSLATVLSPLVGENRTPRLKLLDFAGEVRKLKVAPEEELRSYDVSVPFTSPGGQRHTLDTRVSDE